jgi:S-DNA-T family DNA segregation ATPase FtsK/SpoIIIE
VAAAALDPAVTLTLLDGKLVELAAWRECAVDNVGPSVTDAIDVLSALQGEMDERYRSLLALRRRKIEPGSGVPLHVVVIDELAFYLGGQDRKQRERITELLRDLVSRGRAAGIIVLAATQKPSADVIPTQIRDLFGFRVALRCSTPQASDTVLGQGWAALGYSAASVDPTARGVGFLLAEGGVPVRFRSCHLSDDEIEAIAGRATALRRRGGR